MTGKHRDWAIRVLATLAFIALSIISIRGLIAALPGAALLDFGSFVASGRAAATGLDPYGIHPLTFHVVLPGFESWNPNLNPPISVIFFQLFDLAEPQTSFRIWWGISIACYAATVLLLVRRYGGADTPLLAAWAFALAGFWDTLVLGQIYLPLVLAAAGAWLLIERQRWILAGFLIGLVIAVKPNFLVWPAILFLAGYWRVAISSGVTAAIISAVPLLVYGPGIYWRWLELVASDENRAVFLTNGSLLGLTARIGAPWLGTALSLALLAGLAAWAWRRRPTALCGSELALVAALLASPLAWIHYTLFLLPPILRNKHSPLMCVSAAILTVPVWSVLRMLTAPSWVTVTLGSLYAWAILLCFVALVVRVQPPAEEPALLARPPVTQPPSA